MTPDVEKVAVRAFAAAIMAYLDWPEQESWTIAAALVRKAAEAAERQALRQRVFSPGGSTLSPAEQATISASYRAALDELAEFEARWGHHRDATGRFNETIATSPIPRPAGSGNMDMSA